jgi:hypothetical protein
MVRGIVGDSVTAGRGSGPLAGLPMAGGIIGDDK